MVNEKSLKNLKKIEEKGMEKIKYIIKNRMIILVFDNYRCIKILFYPDRVDKLINISFNFYDLTIFDEYSKKFEQNNSYDIFQYLLKIKIIFLPKYIYVNEEKNELAFRVYNEEEYLNPKMKF